MSETQRGLAMWQCGRCEKWNKVEDLVCKSCGAESVRWAIAFQYHNQLTPQEERFYQGTALEILKELKAIRNLLESKVGGQDGNSNERRSVPHIGGKPLKD